MLKFFCLLGICVASISASCVRVSRGQVYCRNEVSFRQLFRSVTKLKIVDSILQPQRLVMFPDVQLVEISGTYRLENCNALQSTGITLIGCDGDYTILNSH